MNRTSLFYRIVNAFIRILGAGIVFILFLHSIFSTSFMGTVVNADGVITERTRNIADSPIRHLIVFVCFVVCMSVVYCVFLKYKYKLRSIGFTEKVVMNGLFVTAFLVSTLFIVGTQLAPVSDQVKVYEIAMQWRRGNFSSFAEGGYLFRYPFQSGIVLFYYLLTFVVGVNNYAGIQFINVIALVCCYYFMSKLSARLFCKDELFPVLGFVVTFCFIPIVFYTAYLYGILPGMAFSIAATYLFVGFLEKRRYRDMVGCALCIGIAIVLKSNCLIYLAAFVCYLLYDIIEQIITGYTIYRGRTKHQEKSQKDNSLITVKNIRRKEKKPEAFRKHLFLSIVCLLLILISYAGFSGAYEKMTEQITGYELPEGEVMISWVVMGLQDAPMGPGFYNGYIGDVFTEYQYDTEKITEASIAEIKKTVKKMINHPLSEGLVFFARKTAFQWNDPTFMAMDRTRNRVTSIQLPAYMESLIDGEGSVRLSVVFNYFQTLVWIGILLYLYLRRNSESLNELIGIVVFIGGCLFHFVWESSPTYTMPYFFLILPYAAKGYADLIRILVKCRNDIRNKKFECDKKAVIGRSVWALVIIAIVTAVSMLPLFDTTIAIDEGEDAHSQYYTREVKAQGLEGVYCVKPYLNENVCVTQNNGVLQLSDVGGFESLAQQKNQLRDSLDSQAESELYNGILVENREGAYQLRFQSNEQVLAAFGSEEMITPGVYMDDSMNMYFVSRNDVSYRWKLKKAEENVYYILNGNMALTVKGQMITLEPFAEADEQKFVFAR